MVAGAEMGEALTEFWAVFAAGSDADGLAVPGILVLSTGRPCWASEVGNGLVPDPTSNELVPSWPKTLPRTAMIASWADVPGTSLELGGVWVEPDGFMTGGQV